MMMLFERIFVPIGALYTYFVIIWIVYIFYDLDRFLWLGVGHTAWAGRAAGQPAGPLGVGLGRPPARPASRLASRPASRPDSVRPAGQWAQTAG